MTDEQWLSAMHKYSPQRPRNPADWTKGGIHELCAQLVRQAQADKPRFAAMALRMPDAVPADYFGAILDGLSETHGALPDELRANAIAPQPLGTATIFAVVRRLHGLAGHPCGRVICSSFAHLAGQHWPDEAFALLSHYALHDADPEQELWRTPASGGTPYYGGDPESAGLNSVRGGAAYAVARLLFADMTRWPNLEQAVRALAVDRSLAVRAMAVECLLAMMNIDRDAAVRLFLELVKGPDEILGGRNIDQFLHHASFAHYLAVRPILLSMLQSSRGDARASAGRQIAVASFHTKCAEEDLQQALGGDEHCRAGAAEVFAHNLGHEAVRGTCRQHLLRLFNDDSKKVRDAAEVCFRSLSDQQLAEEKVLIYGFIQSKAFSDGFSQLSLALENSAAQLPDVVCAIPERLVAQHLAETPSEPLEQRHNVYGIPELVLRIYQQTPDPVTKSRCLAVVDSMLELGFSSLESELEKVER